MLKYKITFVSFFLVFAFFVSCKNNDKNQKKENPPVSVDVIIAGEDDLLSEIEVNGTVLSEEMIELHPEVSGRLTYLNVPDGATVKEGTILAKINDADLQAELKKLTAQLELANKTEERLKKLLEIIRDRSFEHQRYRASGLNLVTAAIVLWNTVYLERTIEYLRKSGQNIDESLLQYLSPLGWEHINLTGDYVWNTNKQLKNGEYRSLRMLNSFL